MSRRWPLFVYGTLVAEGPQAFLLRSLPREAAWVHGKMYRLPAGYPALELGGEGRAHGELVGAPPDRLLSLLDQYEGVSEGLFERVITTAWTEEGRTEAWVYAMRAPRTHGGVAIPSGRWRVLRRR